MRDHPSGGQQQQQRAVVKPKSCPPARWVSPPSVPETQSPLGQSQLSIGPMQKLHHHNGNAHNDGCGENQVKQRQKEE